MKKCIDLLILNAKNNTDYSFQAIPASSNYEPIQLRHSPRDVTYSNDETAPVLARRMDFLSDFFPDFLDDDDDSDDDSASRPKKHRKKIQQEEDGNRLLSPSAFSKISQTLGALNTVGNFLVNMTRGGALSNKPQPNRGDMQLISTSAASSSLPSFSPSQLSGTTASVTLDVHGLNATESIEPLIKRVGVSGNDETANKQQTLDEKIDMDALAEKKRKKHQAFPTKKEPTASKPVAVTVTPGEFYCISKELILI